MNKKHRREQNRSRRCGAEGGIWTLAPFFRQPTPLAGEPLRPLGYFRIAELQPVYDITSRYLCQYIFQIKIKKLRLPCFEEVRSFLSLAGKVGFEPTDARTSPVFKTGAINPSAISPCQSWMQELCYHLFSPLSIFTPSNRSLDRVPSPSHSHR